MPFDLPNSKTQPAGASNTTDVLATKKPGKAGFLISTENELRANGQIFLALIARVVCRTADISWIALNFSRKAGI